jgi:hypothetical protein
MLPNFHFLNACRQFKFKKIPLLPISQTCKLICFYVTLDYRDGGRRFRGEGHVRGQRQAF